jgi:hypothetical protein
MAKGYTCRCGLVRNPQVKNNNSNNNNNNNNNKWQNYT